MIRIYWEFDQDEPCEKCKRMVKTIFLDSNKIHPDIWLQLPYYLIGRYLCVDCWNAIHYFEGSKVRIW